MAVRFVHALPNAWFPTSGNRLTLAGMTAAEVATACQGASVISHVRYPDHAEAISAELGIALEASGENAPNPVDSNDQFIAAIRSPGSVAIQYVAIHASSKPTEEAGE